MCLYQTPGRRPQPITGRFANIVTRGWVGAPNRRAPFRFHGAVVDVVDRCLSRTRNLAASNKHLAEFFSGRSWPKIGLGMFFFGVFEKFETFFSKICAHSERYRNLLAGIFEILTFYGNVAFPLSQVSTSFFVLFSFCLVLLCAISYHTVSFSRCGSHGMAVAVLQSLSFAISTNRVSVCACVRIMWACHPEHNEGRFQPTLPLNVNSIRAVQQRYNSSSSSGATPVNLATLT